MADKIVIGILRALLTADTAQFEAGMTRAAASMKVFSKDAGQFGRQATSIGSSLTMALTLPLIGFGAVIAKAGIDFEQTFAGVRKTVEATEPELQKIAQQFRQMSREIPVTTSQLNELGATAGALGIPTEQIAEFTRAMAMLSVTTSLTADAAATAIAQIQNVFNAAGKDTDRFGSAIVELGNKGASTESQIVEMASRLASAANSVGMSQADLLAFSAAMANVGIEAEKGGSAMSRQIRDIALAVATGSKDLEGFASVSGMTVKDFSDLFRKDATAALQAFFQGLGQVHKTGGDLIKTVNDLGIVEVRQADTVRLVALAYSGPQGLARAIQLSNDAWKASTALSIEAQKRYDTVASQLKVLWNAVTDVARTVGIALLPLMRDTIDVLKSLIPLLDSVAGLLASMPKEVQGLAFAFGGLVAIAPPTLYFVGQLAIGLSGIVGLFAKGGLGAKALGGTITIMGTAFTGAGIAIGAMTVALGLIVVPLALIAVYELVRNIQGLLSDSEQWRVDGLKNAAIEARAFAEASRIAGKEVTDLTERNAILNKEAARLRIANLGYDPIAAAGLQEQIDKIGAPEIRIRLATSSFVSKLTDAQRALKGLSVAERQEIAAAIQMNATQEEKIALLGRFGISATLAEGVLKIFTQQQQAAKKEASDLVKWIEANKDSLNRLNLAVKDAAANGIPMNKFLDEFGTQLDEAVTKAQIFGQQIPLAVMKAAAEFSYLEARKLDLAKPLDLGDLDLTEMRDQFAEEQKKYDARDERATKSLEYQHSVLLDLAQLDIDLAERRGASARELFDLTEQLERRKLDLAIASANARFALESRDAKKNYPDLYRELEGAHNEMIASMNAEWQVGVYRRAALFESEFEKMLKSVGSTVRDAFTGGLGKLIFGDWGRDVDGSLKAAADKAEQTFLKIRNSGKATAEELTLAMERWREAQERANAGFGQRWKEFWAGIKQTFIRVLDDMLQHFLNDFIKGVIRGIGAANLGQRVAGWLGGAAGGAGGGGGVGGLAQQAAGLVVPGLLGGGGAAAAGGLLPNLSTPALTAGLSGAGGGTAAGGGAAAAGGAGGGVGGSFLTNPAFWTNPYTIAAIGTGLLLTWGITKKGWFRGGEEGVQVNPRRDKFQLQFGGPPVSAGGQRLAAMLSSFTGEGGGGRLFAALQAADSVKEFEAAQSAIVGFLGTKGKRVKSFAFGGFVPPGAIVPAVLHGGQRGEWIMPGSQVESAPESKHVVINHYTSIEGVIDRHTVEEVYRDHIIPLERLALELNTDDLLVTHQRVIQAR